MKGIIAGHPARDRQLEVMFRRTLFHPQAGDVEREVRRALVIHGDGGRRWVVSEERITDMDVSNFGQDCVRSGDETKKLSLLCNVRSF